MNDISTESLIGIANQLRIHSIAATTAAGSGHPTSCLSAADLVAALFFGHMRYDAKNPHYHNNDRLFFPKATPRRCSMPPGRKRVCFRRRNC